MYFSRTKLVTTAIVLIVIFCFIIIFSSQNRNSSYITVIESQDVSFRPINRTTHKLFDVNFRYVLNNESICEKDTNILALFIVTSYFGNTETRSAMRRAFSSEDLKLLNFRRVFLLGEAPTDKYVTQSAVEDESRRFGDLIQGNFIEAYRNLTYKHVMGLNWAADFCFHAKFVIKMDDDIVVNLERIPKLLNLFTLPKSGDFIAGYVMRNMFPIREPANKWYVTLEEYEKKAYPVFVSGWFYVTTPYTAAKLVTLSRLVQYFWIDDTYITGILAKTLKIRHFDISEYFTVHSEYLNCCIQDIRMDHLDCNILIGPNGGDSNLFYDFNTALNICNLKLCKPRTKPINKTCVAERKEFLGRGKAIVETYKLH